MFRTPVSKTLANPQPPGTDCYPSTAHPKHKPDDTITKKLTPGKAIFGRALFQPLAVLTRTPLARTQTADALAESCHPIAMRNLTCPAPQASDGMAQQLGQQAWKQGPCRTRRRPGFAGNKSLDVTAWRDQQGQRATNNSCQFWGNRNACVAKRRGQLFSTAHMPSLTLGGTAAQRAGTIELQGKHRLPPLETDTTQLWREAICCQNACNAIASAPGKNKEKTRNQASTSAPPFSRCPSTGDHRPNHHLSRGGFWGRKTKLLRLAATRQ